MTVTVTTTGFVDFAYTYYADGNPATFWGITTAGATVLITYNDNPFGVATYQTIPAPAKPATVSTAGTTNNAPVLFQAIGAPIPIIWGSMRINGVQLWATAAYNSGNSVGNVADVAVAWGTPLEIKGDITATGPVRFWGNSNLFYDSLAGGSSVGNFTFADYLGTETQLADPTIQLANGANGTPAFRGLVYDVFKALPLSAFNNSVAATVFATERTIISGRPQLTYAIDKLAQRGGFPANSFTTVGTISDAHDGGVITSTTDFIALLQGFANIYNFLILEHPLRLKRIASGGGLVIDRVIPESECIGNKNATDDVVLVSDAEPWTIPNQISLSYISAALNYQKATVPVRRPIFPFSLTGPLRIQTYDLPLVITDSEAANLAWLYLYRLWQQSKTLTFTTLPKHADIEPGDVIQITSQGVTYTAFVTRSTIRPDFSNAIIATALLTNTTINLTADPGNVKTPQVVCPVTNWTTLDGASASNAKVTNCGLTAGNNYAQVGGARSLSGRTSGKYIVQFKWGGSIQGDGVGVAEVTADFALLDVLIHQGGAIQYRSGFLASNSVASSFVNPAGTGDVVTLAIDLDHMLFWSKVNSGNWNNFALADPASQSYGVSMSAYTGQLMSPVVTFHGSAGSTVTANFGQSSFVDKAGVSIPIPSGFTAGWPL